MNMLMEILDGLKQFGLDAVDVFVQNGIVGKVSLGCVTLLVLLIGFLLLVLVWNCLVWLLVEPLREGKVVAKRHEPERHWMQFHHVQIGQALYLVPIFHSDDEGWILIIEATDEKGKTRQGCINLSKAMWDKVKIGDRYSAAVEELEYHDVSQETGGLDPVMDDCSEMANN